MSPPAHVYGVAQLDSGSRRWAVMRDGEVLITHRLRASAERQAEALGEFLELIGEESAMVEVHLRWLKDHQRQPDLKVSGRRRGFRQARCSCGWAGPLGSSNSTADFQTHREAREPS